MQFTKVISILAMAATAVHASPAAGPIVAARHPEPQTTIGGGGGVGVGVGVNVTGVVGALTNILSGLGDLTAGGSAAVGNLIEGALIGGGAAVGDTADAIADVLEASPQVAAALTTLIGNLGLCANATATISV